MVESPHCSADKRFRQSVDEADVFSALKQGNVSPFYQPIIHNITGRVEKHEALMRLQSPSGGFLLPDQFLDSALKTGRYLPLMDDFLDQVCLQFQGTQNRFSFNLFVRDILDPKVREHVLEKLLSYGLSQQATLEILEWDDAEDYDELYLALTEFYHCGVHLALDDFFTKYSTFRRLELLQRAVHEEIERQAGINLISCVKIDRSHIQGIAQNPELYSAVQEVVTLMKQWGGTTVAEGVETLEDFHTVRNLEMGSSQGWLFAKATSMPCFPNVRQYF